MIKVLQYHSIKIKIIIYELHLENFCFTLEINCLPFILTTTNCSFHTVIGQRSVVNSTFLIQRLTRLHFYLVSSSPDQHHVIGVIIFLTRIKMLCMCSLPRGILYKYNKLCESPFFSTNVRKQKSKNNLKFVNTHQ